MRYTLQLQSCRYRAKNRKFVVYIAREKNDDNTYGGWAYVVFRGRIPDVNIAECHVWGDWVNTDKYGSQLRVRTWLPADELDSIPPAPTPADFPSQRSSSQLQTPLDLNIPDSSANNLNDKN